MTLDLLTTGIDVPLICNLVFLRRVNSRILYSEWVDRAMKKILAKQPWTAPQRKWLERISKQLKVEGIVDREALNQGEFQTQGGGFDRLNKLFSGQLEEILAEIGDRLWQEVG